LRHVIEGYRNRPGEHCGSAAMRNLSPSCPDIRSKRIARITAVCRCTAAREYAAHYNAERDHQRLGGRLIEPPANENATGSIACRERLGGLLRFYHRGAA